MQSTDRVQTRDGQPLEVRELHAEDAREFGRFFAGLGAETRSYFGPHPLDAAEAARLCAAQPEPMARRIVAIADGLIAGYFILELGVRDEDADRYRARGQELNPGRVATLAPVMADDWQNRGVAGAVFPSLLRVARAAGRDSLLLMGGTQKRNARAVRFYLREGFQPRGEFEHPPGIWNIDMTRAL